MMRFVVVWILSIYLALVSGLVFAVDLPECDSEEIQDEWESHEERLLEGINTHVKEARQGNSSYIGHADLACFTEHYLYLYIESEREREERVRTLMEFKASAIYAEAVKEARKAGSFEFQTYYEKVLCELELLAYLPQSGDCNRPAVPILRKLIKANKEAREKNEQKAFAYLQKLKPQILKRIKAHWNRPSSFSPGLEVELLIRVKLSGEVISVDVARSSGNNLFDVSAELAAKKASPLPFPDESQYYDFIKEFPFNFRPEEPLYARLTVRSTVSKAEVYIDGDFKGHTPFSINLNGGQYKVSVEKEGYVIDEKLVRLVAGEEKQVPFTLEKKTTTFNLKIQSSPSGANIWIDGKRRGTTPAEVAVERGSHTIKLTKDGYDAKEATINASSNLSRNFTLTKKVKTSKEVDFSKFSGAYRIGMNDFCTDCHTSIFRLKFSKTSATGNWDLAPGKLSYRVMKIISKSESSISLSLNKVGLVPQAPMKIIVELDFSQADVVIMEVRDRNRSHQIKGKRL